MKIRFLCLVALAATLFAGQFFTGSSTNPSVSAAQSQTPDNFVPTLPGELAREPVTDKK